MNKIVEKIKGMDKKKIIIGLSSFVILLGVIVTFGVTFSNNDVQVFNDVELSDVVVEDIELSTIEIKEENGTYTYKAKLKANKEISLRYVEIMIKDSNNEEIVTLIGYVGNTLEKNQEFNVEASTDADISNLKSIDYKIVK